MTSGDTIGHYKVLEPLGKGGMGDVFVAEDTRLNRRVALKVLPPVFATDPDSRERFHREAQAIAALNHPGIVTIHSVEEHDGRLLLTMELREAPSVRRSPGAGCRSRSCSGSGSRSPTPWRRRSSAALHTAT